MPKQQPVAGGLNGSTETRLHKQLERAFTDCFGAEQGLRALVELATTQMRARGTSRTAIRNALVRVVNDHQPCIDKRQVRSAALAAMMLQWSDGR